MLSYYSPLTGMRSRVTAHIWDVIPVARRCNVSFINATFYDFAQLTCQPVLILDFGCYLMWFYYSCSITCTYADGFAFVLIIGQRPCVGGQDDKKKRRNSHQASFHVFFFFCFG